MKVAAAEAYECLDAPIDTSFQVKSFGMWDWDVSSNLAYVDPTTAGLFGIDPQLGAQGLDLGEFIGNIHPDDVAGFCAALRAVTLHGGNFETRYRVVANDDVRWVYAKGACFMSKGTPTRFPGTLVDVSDMMLPG
ncbi:MAG: hypothetical protein BGO65_06140 [Afipia sp. 64-13]|nr:MAG: hypothetical protein BGO65_06140 [Afipia sp. 64-13]